MTAQSRLLFEPYLSQSQRWPQTGRHILAQYVRKWIVNIEDVSEFVHAQHRCIIEHAYDDLLTPKEDVYPVGDAEVAARLGVNQSTP